MNDSKVPMICNEKERKYALYTGVNILNSGDARDVVLLKQDNF